MKSLLAKIAIQKGIGLYIGEHEIVVSKAASTPLGPTQIALRREPYTAENLTAAVEQALKPMLGRKRLPVAVALPHSRVFFGARPIHGGNDASAAGMMQKLLSSTNISVDDLTVDLLPVTVNKQAVASVAACRKKYMTALLAGLTRCGLSPARVEPAPFALVRAAAEARPLRRAKAVLRVFLGDKEGLVVLVLGGAPSAWKHFAMPSGGEPGTILCAARTLESQSKHHGMPAVVDYVVVHGRPEVQEKLKAANLPAAIGSRTLWQAGPALDGASEAYAAAVGTLNPNLKAFDLAQTIKARAPFWDIFPWGELACQVALITVMGLMLAAHGGKLSEAYESVRAEMGRHKCLAKSKPADLEKEKKDLTQRIEVLHNFLSSRICWTQYTRDIASRLPDGTLLSLFHGLCDMNLGGRKKETASNPKKSLMLRAAAGVKADGTVPREIDAFLVDLRNNPLLKQEFPIVQLADIKQAQGDARSLPTACFTILCLPQSNKPKGGGGGGDGEKKE